MELLEEVKKILDSDEEIALSYRPNKKRFILINILATAISVLIVFSAPLIIGILGLINIIKFTEEDGTVSPITALPFLLFGAIGMTLIIFMIVGVVMRYKKTIYVVTNKRIIIRTGFIGADYQSIDHASVGMINVRVDFLDKLVKPNPGSISFANTSTPMVDRNGKALTFNFMHIDNPYDAYKEINEYIHHK